MYVSKHVAHTYSVVCKYVCIYVCMYHCFKMKRYEFFYNVFVREAWASIVGWTEGHVPPTFWNWGTEYALSHLLFGTGGQNMLCPPYFLKRICVSFLGLYRYWFLPIPILPIFVWPIRVLIFPITDIFWVDNIDRKL